MWVVVLGGSLGPNLFSSTRNSRRFSQKTGTWISSWARICKRLRRLGIDSKESIPGVRYDTKGYRTGPPGYIGLESIPWLLKRLQFYKFGLCYQQLAAFSLLYTSCKICGRFPVLFHRVATQLPVYEQRILAYSWAMSKICTKLLLAEF